MEEEVWAERNKREEVVQEITAREREKGKRRKEEKRRENKW